MAEIIQTPTPSYDEETYTFDSIPKRSGFTYDRYSLYSIEGTPKEPEEPTVNIVHPNVPETVGADSISIYSKIETMSVKSKKSTWSIPFSYYFKKKESTPSFVQSISDEHGETVIKTWQLTLTKNKGIKRWKFEKSVTVRKPEF
jgi:hypothetical protein